MHRFSASSLHRRVAIIAFPLLLVSTIIPYQFVYIILCLVQLATSVRALSLSRESVSKACPLPFPFRAPRLKSPTNITPCNATTLH